MSRKEEDVRLLREGLTHVTLSSISVVCDADRQILALASISEVAGNPTMTTATPLLSISREKALEQSQIIEQFE